MSDNFEGWEDFLEWNAGGIVNAKFAPEEDIPALISSANLQFIAHVVEIAGDEKVRARQKTALAVLTDDSVKAVGEGYRDKLESLAARRQFLHRRVPEGLCVAILVSSMMVNPFDPYFIKLKNSEKKTAVEKLGSDLGVPKSWVASAASAARKATPRSGLNPWGIVAAIVGIGIIAVTGPLAVALAPAGLTGGAAFLAGLAALGPGGIAGGIGVIGTVAAVGGGTAVAGALSAGTAAQVEQRVVTLHAHALMKRDLRPGTPVLEAKVLADMEAEVVADIQKREKIDDKNSPALVDARKKLKIIQSTLKRLEKEL